MFKALITTLQRKWLEKIVSGEITKDDDPHKWSVYMDRIQERLDYMGENLLWIAENMPELLKDEETEIQDDSLSRHRRLKLFLKVVKALNPTIDVELVKMREEVGL
uniref:Uncharacterized protein n=1 Tax=viral metagenome TaxID=1070528 RepID=A0A6H1ZR67_9ZZZZ